MKRRLLLFVALPLVLAAVALVGIRAFGGSTERASAQNPPVIALDMVKDGNAWCNPVDSSTTNAVGETHYVAICLLNSTVPAADFNIEVTYNGSLNSCSNTGQTGMALDANPDFIGDATAPSQVWNCSGGGLNYPHCGSGDAFITCGTVADPGSITSPWPIAVITFTATAGGTDDLEFAVVGSYDYAGATVVSCPEDGPSRCVGGTDEKGGTPPAPTATPTTAPTATATRCTPGVGECPTSTPTSRAWTSTPTAGPTETPAPSGGGGGAPVPPVEPSVPSGGGQPAVTPPNTGTGPSGAPWATTLMWVLGSCASLSLMAGGFYLRRVRNR